MMSHRRCESMSRASKPKPMTRTDLCSWFWSRWSRRSRPTADGATFDGSCWRSGRARSCQSNCTDRQNESSKVSLSKDSHEEPGPNGIRRKTETKSSTGGGKNIDLHFILSALTAAILSLALSGWLYIANYLKCALCRSALAGHGLLSLRAKNKNKINGANMILAWQNAKNYKRRAEIRSGFVG